MIHICNFRSKVKNYINTTSRSTNWSRGLSPFFLGPVKLYGHYTSQNVENAWQFSKVYPTQVDGNNDPTLEYFAWAKKGWADTYAHRYPMGKGKKPLYSYWDGERLLYIEARKKIYAPLYAEAVEKNDAYKQLEEEYKKAGEIWLWDFDGYDHHKANMTYEDVLNCPTKKMGHAFVLAMMLEGQRLWEIPCKSSAVTATPEAIVTTPLPKE
jgi:hypothetical protein